MYFSVGTNRALWKNNKTSYCTLYLNSHSLCALRAGIHDRQDRRRPYTAMFITEIGMGVGRLGIFSQWWRFYLTIKNNSENKQMWHLEKLNACDDARNVPDGKREVAR